MDLPFRECFVRTAKCRSKPSVATHSQKIADDRCAGSQTLIEDERIERCEVKEGGILFCRRPKKRKGEDETTRGGERQAFNTHRAACHRLDTSCRPSKQASAQLRELLFPEQVRAIGVHLVRHSFRRHRQDGHARHVEDKGPREL